ncbi:diadenylate cyclase CdaA [Porphyromonadaceae bacterium W3.11]|nr:diadenylate cyclase CdaA [Porphyromonadaceae bacterium W3.11]
MEWLPFSFIDFLDIILVGLMLYYTYDMLRKSGSGNLFIGVISLIIIWILTTQLFKMKVLGGILDAVMGGVVVIVVILFQEEIRRFLNMLGSTGRWRFLRRLFKQNRKEKEEKESSFVAMLSFACSNMARKKTGALIVIEQEISLEAYAHTGEILNADVNSRLIENIFFKNSPLHDGAMIIRDYSIVAAGCILPVAQGNDLPKEMGLRHRSGLGMSQQCDAKVIIISEERGKISLAHRGELLINIDINQLQRFLSSSFNQLSELGAVADAKTKV